MAEEVPRWFGFSIVLVYLIGLGAVGYFGIAQVREDGSTVVQLSSRYAVKHLAEWLAAGSLGAKTRESLDTGSLSRLPRDMDAVLCDDERAVGDPLGDLLALRLHRSQRDR